MLGIKLILIGFAKGEGSTDCASKSTFMFSVCV